MPSIRGDHDVLDEPAELELVAKRSDFLELLNDEPARKRDLVEALDHSRSTVNRAMERLTEAGLVERRGDGQYETTLAGRLLVEKHRTHVAEFRSVVEERDVLAPLDADAPIAEDLLIGAETLLAAGPTPREPLRVVENAIRGAERLTVAMPALVNPRHLELCRNVAADGGEVELIVTPELYERLESRYADLLADVEAGGGNILTAALPDYSLFVADRDGQKRALAVIFAERTGVHGVVHNDAVRALEWATDRLRAVREGASETGGVEAAGSRDAPVRGAADVATDGAQRTETEGVLRPGRPRDGRVRELVEYTLECEGFVRLTDEYFERRAPASPETCLRTGFDLVDVRAGLAFDRERPADDERVATEGDAGESPDDGRDAPTADEGRFSAADHGRETVAASLVEGLRDGDDIALLGPPGSGKRAVCRSVACRWFEGGAGAVLYREADGAAFESTAALERFVRETPGRTLVVVEDALRPDAADGLEIAESLRNDDGVAFLLETRDDEWASPDGGSLAPRIEAYRRDHVATAHVPRLDERECERLIAHVTGRLSLDVDLTAEELLAAVRDDRSADEGTATPGAMVLAWHVLARQACGGAGGSDEVPTALDASVARTVDAVAEGDVARLPEVAVLANLLNARERPVTPAVLHAVATDGDHGAVRRARSALEGEVLFSHPDDATAGYRTPHRTWSRRFLVRLAERTDVDVDFGGALTALLTLADDPDRREAVAAAVEGHAPRLTEIDLDPESWASSLATAVYDAGVDLPALATWFGAHGDPAIALPDACRPTVPAACTLRRARAYFAAGESDRTRRECLALIAPDLAPEQLAGEDRLGTVVDDLPAEERRRYAARALEELAHLGQRRAEYDRARAFAEASRRLAADLDDGRAAGDALNALGAVAWATGDLEEAERRYCDALERYRGAEDTIGVANALSNRAMVARASNDLAAAEEYERESLRRHREVGTERCAVEPAIGLGITLHRRGDLEGARKQLERAIDLAQGTGADHSLATAATNLAAVETATGDYGAAADRLDRARATFRRGAATQKSIACLANRADLELARGDPDAALSAADEAIETARERDKTGYVGAVLRSRAEITLDLGDAEAAYDDANRSVEIARSESDPRSLSRRLTTRGRVRLERGDVDAARSDLVTALEQAREAGDRRARADARRGLGRVATRDGDRDGAIDHLDAAGETFAEIGAAPAAVETYRLLADLATDAGDDELERRCRERIDDLGDRADVPDDR